MPPEDPRTWINPGFQGPKPGCEGGSPFVCDPGPGFGDEATRVGRQIIIEQRRQGGAGEIFADAARSWWNYYGQGFRGLATGTSGASGARGVPSLGGGSYPVGGPRGRGGRRRRTGNASTAGLEQRLRIQREQIRRQTVSSKRAAGLQRSQTAALRAATFRGNAIAGYAAFIADEATKRSFRKLDEAYYRRRLGTNFPADPGKRGRPAAPQPVRTIDYPELPVPARVPQRAPAPAPAPGPARRADPRRPSPVPTPAPGNSPVRRPVDSPSGRPLPDPARRTSPNPMPGASPGWLPWELPIPELRPVSFPLPRPLPARVITPRAVPLMPSVVAVPRSPSTFPSAPPAASPLTTLNPSLLTSLQPEPQPELDPCAKAKPKRQDQKPRCRNPVLSRTVHGDVQTTKVRLQCPRSRPKPR